MVSASTDGGGQATARQARDSPGNETGISPEAILEHCDEWPHWIRRNDLRSGRHRATPARGAMRQILKPPNPRMRRRKNQIEARLLRRRWAPIAHRRRSDRPARRGLEPRQGGTSSPSAPKASATTPSSQRTKSAEQAVALAGASNATRERTSATPSGQRLFPPMPEGQFEWLRLDLIGLSWANPPASTQDDPPR